MRSAFRDLAAYRLAVVLADELHIAIKGWPQPDRSSVGLQLLRSVDSIGANIAEASGRWHKTEERRFLYIARGSLYETEHWLATAERRNLLDRGMTQRLTPIAQTLNGLIQANRR